MNVPVAGDLPAPSKIVCVGRNYAAHARELGNEVPAGPLLFLKAPSALLATGRPIILPPDSSRVEHEGEIALIMGRRARHLAAAEAMTAVAGFAPLNDVTARDLQRLDVQYTRAKSYDTFCPLGPLVPAAAVDWRALEVECTVNGTVRQRGRSTDMVFPFPVLLAFITRVMTLEPGDIVATGTPAGVGPLVEGDQVAVSLPGLAAVTNPVRMQA
jgi:2-keto-4-pentenoate hydratase/2-oxohepta-3-ene-1,7-dioic acid hydratase in catechol pathway